MYPKNKLQIIIEAPYYSVTGENCTNNMKLFCLICLVRDVTDFIVIDDSKNGRDIWDSLSNG